MSCCTKKQKGTENEEVVKIKREDTNPGLLNTSQIEDKNEGSLGSKSQSGADVASESSNLKVKCSTLVENSEAKSGEISSNQKKLNDVSILSSSLTDVSISKDILPEKIENIDENIEEKTEENKNDIHMEGKFEPFIPTSSNGSEQCDDIDNKDSSPKEELKNDKLDETKVSNVFNDTTTTTTSSSSSVEDGENNNATGEQAKIHERHKTVDSDDKENVLDKSYQFGAERKVNDDSNVINIDNKHSDSEELQDINDDKEIEENNMLEIHEKVKDPGSVGEKLKEIMTLKHLTETEKDAARERFGWSNRHSYLPKGTPYSNDNQIIYGFNNDFYGNKNLESTVAVSPARLTEGINPLIARLSPKNYRNFRNYDDYDENEEDSMEFSDSSQNINYEISPNLGMDEIHLFSPERDDPYLVNQILNYPSPSTKSGDLMGTEVDELDLLIQNEKMLLEKTKLDTKKRKNTGNEQYYDKTPNGKGKTDNCINNNEIIFYDSPPSPTLPTSDRDFQDFIKNNARDASPSKIKVININLESMMEEDNNDDQEIIPYEESGGNKPIGNGRKQIQNMHMDNGEEMGDMYHDHVNGESKNNNLLEEIDKGIKGGEDNVVNPDGFDASCMGDRKHAATQRPKTKTDTRTPSSYSSSGVSDGESSSQIIVSSTLSSSTDASTRDSEGFDISSDVSLTFGKMIRKSRSVL